MYHSFQVTALCCCAAIAYLPTSVDAKAQYVMPMLGGFKMSLPYDIANLFLRPIAGSIGVFLSISLLLILIFGVITSPFGYMFGIPSRKYVLGGHHQDPQPRSLDFADLNKTMGWDEDQDFPDFEYQPFALLPPGMATPACKLLALCEAHKAVKRLPKTVLRLVRWFSKELIEMTDSSADAIKTGLQGKAYCEDVYTDCQERSYTMIFKTFHYWLPKNFKNHQHRRKKGMYMK